MHGTSVATKTANHLKPFVTTWNHLQLITQNNPNLTETIHPKPPAIMLNHTHKQLGATQQQLQLVWNKQYLFDNIQTLWQFS